MPAGVAQTAALAFILMTALAAARPPVRVACLGDSITYGAELPDRATQSYPAVLERLAAGRFVVGNFGVNGATALNGIFFRSWTDTLACRDALVFAPDLVVAMLGINDLAFSDQLARYPADLRALVERFQRLPSAPRVFLCTLTPIAPAEQQGAANRAIRDTLNPAIRAVAAETGATIIDISAAFPNRLELLPDGLHPSPEGTELIARAVLAALDAPPPAPTPHVRPAPAAGPVDLSIRNEARAARERAAHWLKTQPPPADLPDPLTHWRDRELRAPEDVAELLPLLAGDAAPGETDPYFALAALAAALDRIGHETVFLAADRPVAWREALLHRLVQAQRNDARGGGFWSPPAGAGAAADSVRATAYALQALAAALGE